MAGKSLKSFRVNVSPLESIEPEEIFFDSQKLKQLEEDPAKFEKPIKAVAFLSFDILYSAIIVFIAAFTAYIAIGKGDEYLAQAQDNSSRASLIFAERGMIFSSDGMILAQNESLFNLFVQSAQLKEYSPGDSIFLELSNSLSAALGRNSQDIYQKLLDAETKNLSEYAIIKGVFESEIEKIDNILLSNPFLEIRETSRRKYPDGPSFSHILGYTGEVSSSDLLFGEYSRGERIGKVGIEAFYDDVVRGENGILIREIDSQGNILNQKVQKEARRGKNITLHINSALQNETYNILKRHARALSIDAAGAVVLDPRNGHIISLASLPAFEGNLFESGMGKSDFETIINDPKKPLFNRVTGGEYPSGSTIKPIIAAAALQENLVTPSLLVYSDGKIEVPSAYDSSVIYKFEDWKAHGWTDMRKAIADSVNVYFYTIGGGYKSQEGLGIKNIENYLKKFNWGKKLGIDLPGERSGFIPTPKWKKEQKGENWYIGDTYLTSIGQGDILATPLQIAASTMVFANGGTLFVPRVISKIQDEVIAPKVMRANFLSKETVKVVREGLRRAVESGSAVFLSDFPHKVAGKTGTAQTGRRRNHAWFTAFAPYDNPSVVLTVLLEEGEKSDYAVRVAKEILDSYFRIYPQN